MFVIEDPGKNRSARDRFVQQAQVRSHLTAQYHKRRRRDQPATRSSKSSTLISRGKRSNAIYNSICVNTYEQLPHGQPSLQSSHSSEDSTTADERDDSSSDGSSTSWQILSEAPKFMGVLDFTRQGREGRALQFFRERTAVEWSGWHDAELWNILALQTSSIHESVRHALVSLGAYHEAVEATDSHTMQTQMTFSTAQAHKALGALVRDNQSMSVSSILASYTMLAVVAAFIHPHTFFQTIQAQYLLMQRIENDPSQVSKGEFDWLMEIIKPLVTRQRSRAGQFFDPLLSLRRTESTHFYLSEEPKEPSVFTCLSQARLTLEALLNWTAYITKTAQLPALVIPRKCEHYFNRWFSFLDDLTTTRSLTRQEHCDISLLRVSAKYGLMLIKTMNADDDDEMIFDEFIDDFRDVSDTFRMLLDHRESLTRPNAGFGLCTGIYHIVGNTAHRFCRDPQMRRDMIELLYRARGHESVEDTTLWARVIQTTMTLEEQGIDPPPQTASDIPAENRLRVKSVSFWMREGLQSMIYHRPPYRDRAEDMEEVCLVYVGCAINLDLAKDPVPKPVPRSVPIDATPDMIFGRGYCAWKTVDGNNVVHIRDTAFVFPTPKA